MTNPFEIKRPILGASSELPEQERIDVERQLQDEASAKAGRNSYLKLTATHGPNYELPVLYSRNVWIGKKEVARTPQQYVQDLVELCRGLKKQAEEAKPRDPKSIENINYVSPLDKKSYPVNPRSMDVYERSMRDGSKENYLSCIRDMNNTLSAFGDAAIEAQDTETYKVVLDAQLEIQHMLE